MKSKLIFLNTIGLTGVEQLASELADIHAIRVLPGSNFISDAGCFYRSQKVENVEVAELFSNWSRQLYEKDGRHWAGLCRHMSPEDQKAYRPERHGALYLKKMRARSTSDFQTAVRVFGETFFEAQGRPIQDGESLAVFGKNFLLNECFSRAPKSDEYLLSWTCKPETWMAMISRRLTWNLEHGLHFFLVHSLATRFFELKFPDRASSVSLEDHWSDREGSLNRMCQSIGVSAERSRDRASRSLGLITIDRKGVEGAIAAGKELRKIYGQTALFQACDTLKDWQDRFLSSAEHIEKIERFFTYWDSTAHTNFDFISPIEVEIAGDAIAFCGAKETFNGSFYFYHRLHELTSAALDSPVSRCTHYLGAQEREIGLPLMPYFIRTAIAYIERSVQLFLNYPHSYRPWEGSFFLGELKSEPYQKMMVGLGLIPRFQKLLAMVEESKKCAEQRETQHRRLIEAKDLL